MASFQHIFELAFELFKKPVRDYERQVDRLVSALRKQKTRDVKDHFRAAVRATEIVTDHCLILSKYDQAYMLSRQLYKWAEMDWQKAWGAYLVAKTCLPIVPYREYAKRFFLFARNIFQNVNGEWEGLALICVELSNIARMNREVARANHLLSEARQMCANHGVILNLEPKRVYFERMCSL